MYYDLNVPWSDNHTEMQRTLAFLAELDYGVVALNHVVEGKLPGSGGGSGGGAASIACAIPDPLPFAVPAGLRVLRRCTLVVSDASQNHRLAALTAAYDLVALRPTNEKALQACCVSLDCDLVAPDLALRYPFYFKFKMLGAAVARGVRLEIAYAKPLLSSSSSSSSSDGGSDGGGTTAAVQRRNLITNATGLIRAARSRGIVISSEAPRALACRAPADLVNLAAVWGLAPERGNEAVGREARAVVMQAEMKRRSFRGVIDVVYGGEPPTKDDKEKEEEEEEKKKKRKAAAIDEVKSQTSGGGEVTLSKREKKRRAKEAREAQQNKAEKVVEG